MNTNKQRLFIIEHPWQQMQCLLQHCFMFNYIDAIFFVTL